MILLQGNKIQKGKKRGVAVCILEGDTSLSAVANDLYTLFLRIAAFIISGGILLPVEDMKELYSAIQSLDTITLEDIPSFYIYDLFWRYNML